MKVIAIFSAQSDANGGRCRGRRGWRRFCGRFGRMGWGVDRGSFATSWEICRGACGPLRILSIRYWSHRRCVGWWCRWFAPACHGGCANLLPVPLSLSWTEQVVEVSLWAGFSLFLIAFHFLMCPGDTVEKRYKLADAITREKSSTTWSGQA